MAGYRGFTITEVFEVGSNSYRLVVPARALGAKIYIDLGAGTRFPRALNRLAIYHGKESG